MSAITLPSRPRGRQTAELRCKYERDLALFCSAILEIRSRLDFAVSARGWCYILEEHGLGKGDFDKAQALITECRKSGMLPLDIVAEDSAREFHNLENLDESDPDDEARNWVYTVSSAHERYTPVSFWEGQDHYIEMLVEKVDLKNLFGPICAEFHVPIANARGWSDLNSRAAMMRRFAQWEERGNTPVLLYCGDHDPVGLAISSFLRANLNELSEAIGWRPDRLVIDRFGLNADFIEFTNLSWIDGLETGSGRRLDDPNHPDHDKPHVQDYLRRFGACKVEANALVVRPKAGRDLCRHAINKYIGSDAPERYTRSLQPRRDEFRAAVKRQLQELT